MFLDHIYLNVQAGHGGHGCESYYRRTDRKSVPDGGDGGNGGNVILKADRQISSLHTFRHRQILSAESGTHGSANHKRGKNGADLVVLVPVGTRVFDRKRLLLIRDLTQAGDEVIVVRGAKGGAGNRGGKKKTPGGQGESAELELRIGLRADVFMVGLPNSGKTTLLNLLTGSRAKVETYPFTTQSPEVGMCRISDEIQITLCELPSLYEGSHEGRGMGNSFLRHLELASFIFFVIDPVSDFAPTLKRGLAILKKEIEAYNPSYLEIPFGVIVTKMDLERSREKVRRQKFKLPEPHFFLSHMDIKSLNPLMRFLREKRKKDSHA